MNLNFYHINHINRDYAHTYLELYPPFTGKLSALYLNCPTLVSPTAYKHSVVHYSTLFLLVFQTAIWLVDFKFKVHVNYYFYQLTCIINIIL